MMNELKKINKKINLVGSRPASNGVKFQKGFALIYVILIITISISLTAGIISLAVKELQLSKVARESLVARTAAESGMECMLYNDKSTSTTLSNFDGVATPRFACGRDGTGASIFYNSSVSNGPTVCNGNPGYKYTISYDSVPYGGSAPTGPCFKAYLCRDTTGTGPVAGVGVTSVDVMGYNICDTNSPKRVERGLNATY